MTTELYVSYQAVAKHNVSASLFPSSLSLSSPVRVREREREDDTHNPLLILSSSPVCYPPSCWPVRCSSPSCLWGWNENLFFPLYSSTQALRGTLSARVLFFDELLLCISCIARNRLIFGSLVPSTEKISSRECCNAAPMLLRMLDCWSVFCSVFPWESTVELPREWILFVIFFLLRSSSGFQCVWNCTKHVLKISDNAIRGIRR